MERFTRAQGVYSLSATTADDLAAEPKALGHSMLTYALLAGLQAVDGAEHAGKVIAGSDDSRLALAGCELVTKGEMSCVG